MMSSIIFKQADGIAAKAATTTPNYLISGELENRELRGSEDRPSKCLRD